LLGYNGRGQLGDGTTTDRYVAASVLTLNAGIEAIAAGGNHSCARKSTGALFCWGYNDSGQLGTGTQTDAVAPMAITLSDSIFVEGFDEE
jgi:alpha-tubulin suppressor-like RCC1 family protein